MKVALANSPRSFGKGFQLGCRGPRMALEPGCNKAPFEAAGHGARMLDAHLCGDPMAPHPYPSSPDCRRLGGEPDDHVRERAHARYLSRFRSFNDIQEERPAPRAELEAACRR